MSYKVPVLYLTDLRLTELLIFSRIASPVSVLMMRTHSLVHGRFGPRNCDTSSADSAFDWENTHTFTHYAYNTDHAYG